MRKVVYGKETQETNDFVAKVERLLAANEASEK
jgi:hypothetical protein